MQDHPIHCISNQNFQAFKIQSDKSRVFTACQRSAVKVCLSLFTPQYLFWNSKAVRLRTDWKIVWPFSSLSLFSVFLHFCFFYLTVQLETWNLRFSGNQQLNSWRSTRMQSKLLQTGPPLGFVMFPTSHLNHTLALQQIFRLRSSWHSERFTPQLSAQFLIPNSSRRSSFGDIWTQTQLSIISICSQLIIPPHGR